MMTKNSDPVVKVKKLTMKYGNKLAVNNISFDVIKGEVLAILGPNGAGKTSTIEMLEGYHKPTSGYIRVLGQEPIKANCSWRSEVGMVLQSTSLDEELTVKEVLTMYERLYSNPLSTREVLELVGLSGNENVRVGRLSGGQQRRLDVALGIIGRPKLLFLDEPTTGFDPVARRESWQMVKQLCNQGITVILTTHYMDEAKFLADRIMVFVNGKIVANAQPELLGGSLSKQSLIGFDVSQKEALNSLPEDIRRNLVLNGANVSLLTEHVNQVMSNLIQWSNKHELELKNLTITKRSLEDIYLQLVQSKKPKGAIY